MVKKPFHFEMEELGAIVRNLLERSQIVQSEWRFSQQSSPPQSASSREESFCTHLSQLELHFEFIEREQQVLECLISILVRNCT